MSAGPLDPFNHAVSFVVNCEDQAEIDRYWNALVEGGSAEQRGWLKDRFGLSWQIVPAALSDMMSSGDAAQTGRVMKALLKMKKLDLAELKRAYEGKQSVAHSAGTGLCGRDRTLTVGFNADVCANADNVTAATATHARANGFLTNVICRRRF